MEPDGVLDDAHWKSVAAALGVGHDVLTHLNPTKAAQASKHLVATKIGIQVLFRFLSSHLSEHQDHKDQLKADEV